jgi:kanamycin kinase
LVSDPDLAALAQLHTLRGLEVPGIARDLADGREPELVWRNDLDGLTFRIGDRYLKWNPPSTGINLECERDRLEWISKRHPAPRVVDYGLDGDAQWLLTEGLPGTPAVGDAWRARRPEAIRAIAFGLREMHAIGIDDFPAEWTAEVWVGQRPVSLGPRPSIEAPVLVHGDACAPNTLVSDGGAWTGHVDFGDLAVGDRWADLAIASLSLDWNFGEGHQPELIEAYGIDPDEGRIRYYRRLWELES